MFGWLEVTHTHNHNLFRLLSKRSTTFITAEGIRFRGAHCVLSNVMWPRQSYNCRF